MQRSCVRTAQLKECAKNKKERFEGQEEGVHLLILLLGRESRNVVHGNIATLTQLFTIHPNGYFFCVKIIYPIRNRARPIPKELYKK